MRLFAYFHRGRHRPAAGRTPARSILARRGHMAAVLPDGRRIEFSGLFVERVTDVSSDWQFSSSAARTCRSPSK